MTTKAPTETSAAEQSVVAEDDKQNDAAFEAGFNAEDGKGPSTPEQSEAQQPRDDAGRFAKPEAKPKPKTKDAEPAAETPEYVQLTKQQFERYEAAAKKSEDIEKNFSKVFGTIGDMQKIVRTLQGQTPLEKDFPELATHMRGALEATLKGLEGTGGSSAHVDETAFERKIEQAAVKYQFEALDDEIPDWRKIVGAVDTNKGEKPDPNNPFRKWLATKDKAYQDKINGTNSAGVITRAIRAFRTETKSQAAAAPQPAPKPSQRATARQNRIQDAVRPKGDGGHPTGKNADDEFEAGFKSG